jgi:hypothetical protein
MSNALFTLSVREELQSALDRHTSDGSEAFILVDKIFGSVRALLHKLCPDMSFLEIDLLLGDLQRDVCEDLFDHLHGAIDRSFVDTAVDRFFEGD